MATVRRSALLALVLVCLGAVGVGAAQEFGETIVKRGVEETDLYLAGRTVEVAAEVRGDLVMAGQRVSSTGAVAGDVVAAGEVVSISGPVADDVRASGRLVTVSQAVGDHVVAAGEIVTLSAGASIGSWAWLAGRLVQVLGEVGGELRVAAAEVVIGGTVQGDVFIRAGEVRILDSARILGRLEYTAEDEAVIADGAVIEGDVERLEPDEIPYDAEDAVAFASGFAIWLVLALFVVGLLYVLVFPGVASGAAQCASAQLWAVLGLGLAMFVAVPFVGSILAMTVVGLILAGAVFALYGVMLLVGFVNGAAWLGGSVMQKMQKNAVIGRTKRLVAFAVVLVLLLVVQIIPVLGQLAGLFVWLVGIGSLAMVLAGQYRADASGTVPSA